MKPQSSRALRAPDELGPRYRGRFGFSFNHKRQVRVSPNLAILLLFLRALQVQIHPFLIITHQLHRKNRWYYKNIDDWFQIWQKLSCPTSPQTRHIHDVFAMSALPPALVRLMGRGRKKGES